MDDDDWDLSAEDFDSLERSALQQLSRSRDSARNQPQSPVSTPSNHDWNSSRVVPDSRPNKGEDFPATSRACADEPGKKLLKSSVKFYLHSSGNVAAKFPYDQVIVAAFRKIPNASWNAKERIWMFPLSSLPSAEKVLAEERCSRIEIVNLDPLVCRAIAAAAALPDLQEQYGSMPSVIESKLLPFQRDGVRFVLQHGIRVLIADEMGLGKTLQAIAVAACVRDSWPVLVLTPSSLRLHWATMIQQWLNIPSSDILVLLSQCGGSNRSGFRIVSSNTKSSVHLDGLFNIISYDVVPKLQNLLMSSDFKLVIADESHFLKNAQAKRTTASLPVIKKAQYAILLSGTPALSRPIELHKQLEALYPDVYKNVHEYGQRYCKGGIFGVYQGTSNHEELHHLMKATVMIRRLKKEVLSELPVKRRQQVFLNLADKDMKKINALFCELKVIKERIKACTSKEDAESLKFSEKNLISKIYTDSAEAKIPAVLDYLETVVEAGCKFLIFAHHQPMIDAIHEFLLKKKKVGCIRIDGSTPAVARQALVTDFQGKDAIRAAVLSIRAGGVGLTLTAASTVIFAELSWTPGDLIQAEDRAHRIGQVSSVNIYYLLANDTVDDIIWDVVQSKLENLGQVLDGHEKTLEVSASHPTSNSPAKQKIFNSPCKQKTLDLFVKRCNNGDPSEHQRKLKFPRH
ncbi:SWI/SNF-related matrix-associated actin-dependent regulator of chromatin subfamily A-like protein 1 isoform X1 [Rhodamnia argentea]|uniref:SWI/SNF-related matrix-associated actin-dependent regulator of chromatin subfamily A-like protein 1 isoform X1 n=1 Tax=Rhodamnia argentea TaxID=178133 RepID=A0ABM3GY46_9MYRT|nr:SWI/SNF-related matrix-associated actin-dependent regulator of chromatin subfamily A-like protein 1 isoform X1 [Rhodamnia argentea]XP_048129268.1 SWI/SNF-related matrix-associated actin-dependent regulator of chromatin subfamily A-like protein 1 isoform X1 [Rhodamnia argentea]